MKRAGRILRLKTLLLAVAVAGILVGTMMALFSHRMLIVDSGKVKADAIVLLGGGAAERSEHAAELFKAGAAPRIIVSGIGDCEFNTLILETRGVPSDAITQESRSTSTLENARFSIPLLRAMGAQRVIIVTSWYHSRRALSCFRHFAPDLSFYSCPSYEDYPCRDWVRDGMAGFILREYVKIPGYWLVHGVPPV